MLPFFIHPNEILMKCSALNSDWSVNSYYRPRGKVMFSEVSFSHFVHRGSPSSSLRTESSLKTETLLQTETSLKTEAPLKTETPSRQRSPPDRDATLDRHPLEVTSRGSHCSGRNASYWNAFLLQYNGSKTIYIPVRTECSFCGGV